MVFNCTIIFPPFHSASLQRNTVAERLTGVADCCCRTSVSFALEEGFPPGLVLLLLKKYPCSCFCWAFCSDRSVKAPIEHPYNFYFGGLTASSQWIKRKIFNICVEYIFNKSSQNLMGQWTKKNYSPGRLSLLPSPKMMWLFTNHAGTAAS